MHILSIAVKTIMHGSGGDSKARLMDAVELLGKGFP